MSVIQTRIQHPIRFRKARADLRIDLLQAAIEKKFGLPAGCVKIVTPNGRKQNSQRNCRSTEKKLGRLRRLNGAPLRCAIYPRQDLENSRVLVREIQTAAGHVSYLYRSF